VLLERSNTEAKNVRFSFGGSAPLAQGDFTVRTHKEKRQITNGFGSVSGLMTVLTGYLVVAVATCDDLYFIFKEGH